MYKSRVETFNQVYYFHHLIFLFYIIQEDDMENNLQYFIHRPKQKYRRGKGRWNSTLCLWLCADDFSTSGSGSWAFGERLRISTLPLVFRLTDHWGKNVCNRIIQKHQTETLPLCYWNEMTVIWSVCWLNVWQKRCITLEWSELNWALKAPWFATNGFDNMTCQKLNM